nr:Chain E, proTGF-beta1 RGD peptide [Homo sapiens]6OM2_F Chain F, proTGF-beta1 RGD peptide [Homo sapiens]
GRRGDLATIHG